jgi:putative transposase
MGCRWLRFAERLRSARRPFQLKKKYAGMMPSEIKRLRELEAENVRLKKIVADLSLDKEML